MQEQKINAPPSYTSGGKFRDVISQHLLFNTSAVFNDDPRGGQLTSAIGSQSQLINNYLNIIPSDDKFPQLDPNDPSVIELNTKIDKWRIFMDEYKKQDGVEGSETIIKQAHKRTLSKEKKLKVDAEIDRIQLLPLWLNRAIIKLLPPDTYRSLESVNEYWSHMISDINNENTVRTEINLKSTQDPTKKVQKKTATSESSKTLSEKKNPEESVEAESVEEEESLAILPITEIQRLLNVDTLKTTKIRLAKHSKFTLFDEFNEFRSIAISHNKRLMAVSSYAHSIILYCLETNAALGIALIGHTGDITCLAFHTDHDYLFSGSRDNAIRYWNVWRKKTVKIYKCHQNAVTALAADNEYLISSSSGQIVIQLISSSLVKCLIKVEFLVLEIVKRLEDGCFYVLSDLNTVLNYSLTGACLQEIKAHKLNITGLHLSEKFLATCGLDSKIRIWNRVDLKSGTLHSLENACQIHSVLIYGMYIISGTSKGYLQFHNLSTGKLLKTIPISSTGRRITKIFPINTKTRITFILNIDTDVKVCSFSKPMKKRASGTMLMRKLKFDEPWKRYGYEKTGQELSRRTSI